MRTVRIFFVTGEPRISSGIRDVTGRALGQFLKRVVSHPDVALVAKTGAVAVLDPHRAAGVVIADDHHGVTLRLTIGVFPQLSIADVDRAALERKKVCVVKGAESKREASCNGRTQVLQAIGAFELSLLETGDEETRTRGDPPRAIG